MFSGTVKIADIDDYINPSQECIKPMMAKEASATGITLKNTTEEFKSQVRLQKPASKRKDQELIDLYSDTGGIRPDLIKQSANSTAKISLNDCLACSGCVTTAETILIQEHNADDFMEKVKTHKCTVVSISPQSRSSLAHYYKTNDQVMHYALQLFFSELGVKYFWDQGLAINISVQEAQEEFIKRYRTYREEGKKKENLPVLCSECPGWVCYAEKVGGDEIIPYMSKVRAPQQIMGVIAKVLMPKVLGMTKEDIYCVTIEPCYDKKLEATRLEFQGSSIRLTCAKLCGLDNGIRDVDTVLSALEIMDIVKAQAEKNIDLGSIVAQVEKSKEDMEFLNKMQEFESIEDFLIKSNLLPTQTSVTSGSQPSASTPLKLNHTERANSNSYAEIIMRNSMKILYPEDHERINYEYKLGKNSDLEECKVTLDDKELAIFARVYGLRNIQTVSRNIKKGVSKYHYLEIMACPSGCVNGGGLLKPEDKSVKAKDLSNLVYSLMTDITTKQLLSSEQDGLAQNLRLAKDSNGEQKPLLDLAAGFKAVEKSFQSQLKW